MGRPFIIPQEGRSLIARLEKGAAAVAGAIDLPYQSKSVIAGNGLIVSLCLGEKPKHRRLKIFDPQGRQLIRKTEYKFTCLAHKHNAVYLGGQYRKGRGELFAMLDLSCLDFRAEEIALPLQGVEGKSIDDMLVQGDRLILADNIIFPKYLFEYGIADAACPVHRQTIRLPNNGAYEHIYKGAASEERIVLFSGSVGMNGARRHISILDRRGAALAAFSMADNKLRDIALSGNRLLLLCEDALRGLDLNGTLAKDAVTAIAPNDRGMEKIIAVEDGLCVVCNKNGYAVLDVSPGAFPRETPGFRASAFTFGNGRQNPPGSGRE